MNQPTGIRRVVRDVADLCELQLELLAVDGKVLTRRGSTAIAMVIVAFVFGLAAVTAAVFALASLLHEIAAWTMSGSLIAAAGVAAVFAAFFGILAWSSFKRAMAALTETRSELAENMRWIKTAIVSPETLSTSQKQQETRNGRNSSPDRI